MKKNLGFLLLAAVVLAACGNEKAQSDESDTFKKATEQGKLALADGNTEKALGAFELAKEENPSDEKTEIYIEQLETVTAIETLLDDKKYEKAGSEAQDLLADEEILAPIENITEDLLADAEKGEKALAKKEKEKEVAEKKTEKSTQPVAQTTQTTQSTAPVKQSNMYATYMNQAQLIETNYTEPAYAIDGEAMDSFTPMLNAFNASYAQWDKLLNDIYGTLKSRLSAAEFENLRAVQRNWIPQRDADAQYAKNNHGDYAVEIAEAMSLSSSTSSRCYELLYQYESNLK